MTELTNTESTVSAPKSNRRSAAITAGKAAKFAALFEGKKFRIVEDVTAPKDEPFKTSLGNRCTKGSVIAEIGNESNTLTVGMAVLRRAAEEYDAVVLPPKRPRGRPRKNPVAETVSAPKPIAVTVEWD